MAKGNLRSIYMSAAKSFMYNYRLFIENNVIAYHYSINENKILFWGYIVRHNLYKYAFTSITALAATGLLLTNAMAQDITADDLRPHVKILASDEYEGRLPGTEGGVKTAKYMADQWFQAGLIGGAEDGSYYQTVPLMRRTQASGIVSFQKAGQTEEIKSNEISLVSRESSAIMSIPAIFGGYGVKSDGSVIDNVSGKAVFLRSDNPNFISGDDANTQERIKKLQEAGAKAVILIVDENAPWERVRRFAAGRPVSLQSANNGVDIAGVASTDYAKALAKSAGVKWKKYIQASSDGNFNGMELGLTSNFNVQSNVRKYNSYNVIAKLAGRNPDAGAVVFTGHWDHIGLCGPVGDEDRICNGAVDNASGMAALIEVAKKLGTQKFDRDIYFVGTTAEESGLLGAYHFVDNSPVDIKKIVAALNVDTIAIAPKGAKVAIIGRGTTDLDPIIEKIATDLGREIESSTDANSFIRRQDGWALASKGVPSVMVGGAFADLELLNKFLSSDYHTVRDEYSEKTELGGAAEDAVLHVKLAEHFANISSFSGNKADESANKASE